MSAPAVTAPLTFTGKSHLKQYPFEDSMRATLKGFGVEEFDEVRDGLCVFDLSTTVWSDLGTLLWLISLMHKMRKQGNLLQLILPEPADRTRQKFWDFLIRWKFFDTLSTCVDEAVNLLRPDQVQYLNRTSQYAEPSGSNEFGAEATLHSNRLVEITPLVASSRTPEKGEESVFSKYTDRILISALGQLCGWAAAETTRFVQLVIGEGVKNTTLHAQGSFALVSMRLDPKNLTLAISDNGIGIPDTLRIAYKKVNDKNGDQSADSNRLRVDVVSSTDLELIKLFTEPEIVFESHLIKGAFREGTTSVEGRKGLGLFYLKNTVLEYGGTLRIRSGHACVDFTAEDEQGHGRDHMLNSPGTTLRITAPRRIR